MKKLIVLTVILFVSGLIAGACSSTRSSNIQNINAAANAPQNQPVIAENNNVNLRETPKPAVTEQPKDDLPAFKAGEDYKNSVRGKMLKAGWEPYHAEDAQLCGSGDSTCDEYPEMEACAGSGMGNCKFLWKKADKLAAIFTVGDPYQFSNYAFEKLKKSAPTSDVLGKYVYRYTEDYGGEMSIELKNDSVAVYKSKTEDSAEEGQGSWAWDAAQEMLTVKLPSVKSNHAGEESDSAYSKLTLIFKKADKNLKLVKVLPAAGSQTEIIFKKL